MFLSYFLLTMMLLVGLFLMFVVLIQRGRGGGLAGAFGGLGGQSAFGTKAGDVFTVITIVTACIWVLLACLTGWRMRVDALHYYTGKEGGQDKVQVAPADDSKADDKKVEEDENPDAPKKTAKPAPKSSGKSKSRDADSGQKGAKSSAPADGSAEPAKSTKPTEDSEKPTKESKDEPSKDESKNEN